MRTRAKTLRPSRGKTTRNDPVVPECVPSGRKNRRNGTLLNGTTRKRKNQSLNVNHRSKIPQNRVQVKFNIASEYTEEELFLLRKAVYIQQFDVNTRMHNPMKPIAWFTVAALINVNEWTWDAVKCMNVWQSDQAASKVKVGPFSATEDKFLMRYGEDGTDDFWHNLANVLKRDPGAAHNRWVTLLTTQSSESNGFDSDLDPFLTSDCNSSPEVSPMVHSSETMCDGDDDADTVMSTPMLDLPQPTVPAQPLPLQHALQLTPTQPASTYKAIRKSTRPLEVALEVAFESSQDDADKNGEVLLEIDCEYGNIQDNYKMGCNDDGNDEKAYWEDSWEGSASSPRSAVFTFDLDSLDTATGGAQ